MAIEYKYNSLNDKIKDAFKKEYFSGQTVQAFLGKYQQLEEEGKSISSKEVKEKIESEKKATLKNAKELVERYLVGVYGFNKELAKPYIDAIDDPQKWGSVMALNPFFEMAGYQIYKSMPKKEQDEVNASIAAKQIDAMYSQYVKSLNAEKASKEKANDKKKK